MKPQFSDVVKAHRPVGYKLERRRMTANNGEARLEMTIVINKELEGATALFVFLHECGHVHLKHLKGNGKLAGPNWNEEWEADQYAIGAMKKAGVPIPRAILAHHKSLVRELIEQSDGSEHPSDEVLRYAFGRNWRKHR